jgi:cytochrome c peroxidase
MAAPAPRGVWQRILAALGSALVGFAALTTLAWRSPPRVAPAEPNQTSLAELKQRFARPSFVPAPAENPGTPARVALGRRLFEDTALSSTGTIACASCHDAKLSFADGEPTGRGVSGRRLLRHTPSLWNVAWSPLLFWDGRANSLEDQAHFPTEHPDEMASSLQNAVLRLTAEPGYVQAFAAAFPDGPQITAPNLEKALASYERTLVSPPTRFDRWIAGDGAALSPAEIDGFEIFTGRGRCVGCHSGFAFSDHGFYDIGLPGSDKGRGSIIHLAAANFAFKTPTLRELVWTAPYMHDGSLATLDDVVRHYENGGVRRPTRSSDLPAALKLTDQERDDLVAFLQTLSSDRPPQPSREAWVGNVGQPRLAPAADTTLVSQANKLFLPPHVQLQAGQTLAIRNDDTRTHNVRIYHPKLDFNSGAQEPQETVTIPFPAAGSYDAFCAIHPSMRLRVEVQ